MRIITLNTWGGRAGKEKLLAFFAAHASTTDVFCLQEIWSAPYTHFEGALAGGLAIDHSNILVYGLQEISALLTEFTPYFRPHHQDHYGLLMLVKKTWQVEAEGERFVYKEKGFVTPGDIGNHARNLQYVTLRTTTGPLTVAHIHGLWNGRGKTDTEDRLLQSRNILACLKTLPGEVVLGGDFNLALDTESIHLLEQAGLRNLIREHGVTSTRTSYYTKPEKHADYFFVSSGVQVSHFTVLPEEVSDHAALALDVVTAV